MSNQLSQLKIYHITHLENLHSILGAGCLYSDAQLMSRRPPSKVVGMSTIKARRLKLPVQCYPSTMVGDYVPFYFCPRSIMLYVIHMGNHPELTYHDGQGLVLHLQADLNRVVEWADRMSSRWAFSLTNAGATYAEFRNRVEDLNEIDWHAVHNRDFRDPAVKYHKQAEFLLHETFPWHLVEHIGVYDRDIERQVQSRLESAGHRPTVRIQRAWYF